MSKTDKINYLELAACDLDATKRFFNEVFGWSFTDYGEDYSAFNNAGIEGGFYRANLHAQYDKGSVLIVLYTHDLEGVLARITQAGGTVVKPIFDFPGGRRFHFSEPSGNELAVWSEQ